MNSPLCCARRDLLRLALAAVWPLAANADDYPSRPIKIIAPFPPGGPADVVARVLADALRAELKQTVLVENVAGAGGTLGARAAAQARPDGYTLLATSASTHAIMPAVSKTVPYDPVKDFTPISLIARAVFVVVVHPSVPARTLAELVAAAKAKPGALAYPSSGRGSLIHLAGLQFQLLSGTELLHVPYKGAQPALMDTVSGQLQLNFAELGGVLPFIKTGKVRALAVMSPQRIAALPDVPTVAEAGMPGLDVPGWTGLFAPAGLPKPLTDTLAKATAASLARNDFRDKLGQIGIEPFAGDAEALRRRVDEDHRRMVELVRKSNLQLD